MKKDREIIVTILKQLDEQTITTAQAISQLSKSRSTVFRWLACYRKNDFSFLEHGNKGKRPHNAMPLQQKQAIKDKLSCKYSGFQAPLAKKYLSKEGFDVSISSVSRIQREINASVTEIKKVPHIYALRRRRSRFGELIQIDGSPHAWFGEDAQRACLLAFIDDATGIITAARFYPTENQTGYLTLIKEHVCRYGVPVALYSDRHTIFTRKLPEDIRIEPPQYARVCHRLGIEQILALSPQAKGRIERLFRTLQGRWPKQFQVDGINTIAQANSVIRNYIDDFNKEFGLHPLDDMDAHAHVDDLAEIDRICARWTYRKLNSSLRFSFAGKIYQILQKGISLYGLRYRYVALIQYEDGREEVALIGDLRPKLLNYQVFETATKGYEVVESAKSIDARIDNFTAPKSPNRWIERHYKEAEIAIQKREERKKRLAESEQFLARIFNKTNRD